MKRSTLTSILGGGIATELLKQLSDTDHRKVARYKSNGSQLNFSLCKSYRRESGHWDGHSFISSTTPTGGMVLWADGEPLLKNSGLKCSFYQRLTPKQAQNARYYIGVYITRFCREWSEERSRQQFLKELDELTKPLISNKNFIAAVEKQEEVFGFSGYDVMTTDQIVKWMDWVAEWKRRNHIPD